MKGTILDFLKLASENEQLAAALAEVASRFDFEFDDELSEEELGAVAGGVTINSSVQMPSLSTEEAQLANIDLQNMLQKQQQTIQMMSNISKVLHDTSLAVIRNYG